MTFWFDSAMDGSVGEAVQGLQTLQAQVPRDNGVVIPDTTAGQTVQPITRKEATVVVVPGLHLADTLWAVVSSETTRLAASQSGPKRSRKRKSARAIWSALAIRSLMAPFLT